MKKAVLWLLAAVQIVCLAACAGDTSEAVHPEGYMEYEALLAHDWDEVLDALQLSEAEMTSGAPLGKGMWDTGRHVEYCGADLDVYLYTWANAPDRYIFQGFSYGGFLSSDLHEAARVLSAVAKRITGEQGDANDYRGLRDCDQIADMTVEELEELLKRNVNKDGSLINAWALGFLSTQEGQELQNWVKENNRTFQSEPFDQPQFVLKMNVHFGEGKSYLELKYELVSFKFQGLIA